MQFTPKTGRERAELFSAEQKHKKEKQIKKPLCYPKNDSEAAFKVEILANFNFIYVF